MRNLRNHAPTPLFPELVTNTDLDHKSVSEIRKSVTTAGYLDVFNRFTAQKAELKWGRKQCLTAAKVHAIEDDKGRRVDLMLETSDGHLHPLNECSEYSPSKAIAGMVIIDEDLRGWLCESEVGAEGRDPLSDPEFAFTGSGDLRLISTATPQRLRDFHIAHMGVEAITELECFAGTFKLQANMIVGSSGAPIRNVTGTEANLAQGYTRFRSRVDAILAREKMISDAVHPHITTDKLDALFGLAGAEIEGTLYPGHTDARRRDFEERLFEFTIQIALALREKGLLAPCPNVGPHDVRGITSWNAFMTGVLDEKVSSYSDPRFYARMQLRDSPLFTEIRARMISSSINAQEKVCPDLKSRAGKMTGIEYQEALGLIHNELKLSLKTEDDMHSSIHGELRSKIDGRRLMIMDTPFAPVLAVRTENGKERLQVIDAPKIVRHVELSLPSGRLAMADWFRIKGFNEGIEAICGEDSYEISYAKGLDDRTRDYYQKLGLMVIQVGNTSPSAWADAPGIWRMGRIDEDSEAFWTEDGKPTGLSAPTRVWRTCTDLWANTFADPEVLTDILMASGQYDGREAAMVELQQYLDDNRIRVIDIGAEKIHVYMSTGYGYGAEPFDRSFRAPEIEQREWQTDHYVLSVNPLTPRPDILEGHEWIQGRVDPAISLRACPQAPDGPDI